MYEELMKRLRSHNGWALNKTLDEAADAIEELSGLIDRYGGETGLKNLREYADKYWDLLKNAPRWISVKERLPDEHVFVLIRQDDDRMMVAERVDGEWWYRYFSYDVDRWDENEQGTITHWMPLPEPPKEK